MVEHKSSKAGKRLKCDDWSTQNHPCLNGCPSRQFLDGIEQQCIRIITPCAVTMPPPGSSIRCLQLLRKPIHTTFASPARRFLQTQSRQDPPQQQNKEGWLLRKAAKVDQEMSDWKVKQEESKQLVSEDDLTSEFEAEHFAVPDPLDQPGWILPIPEQPRRHLVSKRCEYPK
jgi:hypothetical protein